MADVYGDFDLTSGLNDGSDWANAYQTLTSVPAGIVAGDRFFVQGDADLNGAHRTLTWPADPTRPVLMIGCIAGTTNEPPLPSDLIPGYRTGDTTPAYDQTGANLPPRLYGGSGGWRISMSGYVHFYAINIDDTWDNGRLGGFTQDTGIFLEECEHTWSRTGVNEIGRFGDSFRTNVYYKSCKYSPNDTNAKIRIWGGAATFDNCVFPTVAASNLFLVDGSTYLTIINSDLSNQVGTGFINPSSFTGAIEFSNNNLPLTWTWLTAPISEQGAEFTAAQNSSSTTLATGDSVQDYYHEEIRGVIELETTIVRDGGASDGATGIFSRKVTLKGNATTENVDMLLSQEMSTWVDGDGTTAVAVTVYLHNLTRNMQDDEIILVLSAPSGSAGGNYQTIETNIGLLAAPADLASDTSLWNGSSTYSQKIVVNFDGIDNPFLSYSGPIYGNLRFAENVASPVVIYYDPKLYVV